MEEYVLVYMKVQAYNGLSWTLGYRPGGASFSLLPRGATVIRYLPPFENTPCTLHNLPAILSVSYHEPGGGQRAS